tara:strand:- start:1084 stop:1296 length:213 start_codon:yes stop_codon:yes gene_type:complete
MCGGSPRAPAPPPAVPEAPRAPDTGSSQAGQDSDKRRRAAATGDGRSTILTSSRGVSDSAATATKTLLGQ